MLKITIIGNASSAHILNWSKVLSKEYIINIISLSPLNSYDIQEYNKNNIAVYMPSLELNILAAKNEGSLYKILILAHLPWFWYLIWKLKQDFVHVHYASSYGLIGALIKTKSLKLLSIWGSDIYNFPKISFLHKYLIKFILSKYEVLQVTSNYMKPEVLKYISNKNIYVVPFPINSNRFVNIKANQGSTITIGTIKTLHHKYGIDKLLRASAILASRISIPFTIKIFGKGPQEDYLKQLSSELGLDNIIEFMGYVPFNQVHLSYNQLDIYLALSVDPSETYGVAILEACSSGLPVIVSDVGGLPEVVINGVTGIVVADGDPTLVAEQLEALILNEGLRGFYGLNARNHVLDNYSESVCIKLQSNLYKALVNV